MCKECKDCSYKSKFIPKSILHMSKNIKLEELFSKDSCGFITNDFMGGLFLNLCHEIKRPVVFIQPFLNECDNNEHTDIEYVSCPVEASFINCNECIKNSNYAKKYYRLEARAFYDSFATTCKYVRKQKNGVNTCKDCGFFNCQERDAKNGPEYWFNIENKDRTEPKEYFCEATGYTEFSYPIRLNNNIMGVLVAGQYLRIENKEKFNNLFQGLSKEFNNVPEFIRDSHLIQYELDNALTDDQIKSEINKITKAVKELEKQLDYVQKFYQEWYIGELLNDLFDFFSTKYSRGNNVKMTSDYLNINTHKYKQYKDAIYETISLMCKRLDIIGFQCLMPDKMSHQINGSEDKVISIGDDNKEEHSLKEYKKGLNKESIKNGYIYTYLYKGDSNGTIPIVLIFYNDNIIFENKSFHSLLKRLTEQFGTIGSTLIAQLISAFNARHTQIMRHEYGQSQAGFNILLKNFEEKIPKNLDINNDFYTIVRNHIKNTKGFIHSTSLRIVSTRYTDELPNPRPTYFYPFGSFLFKWNVIYGEEQKNKKIDFNMPAETSFKNHTLYPMMYGDPDMIEQIVFNITNNAFKYSHFRSIIYLDCYVDLSNKIYIIKVTNFGKPIVDKKEDILSYGVIGSNNENKYESSGLGLYLASKMASINGGDLDFKQYEYSKYNMPLLSLFDPSDPNAYNEVNLSKWFFEDKNAVGQIYNYTDIINEYKELQNKDENTGKSKWEETVSLMSIDKNDFTPLYVYENLYKPTNKIEFILKIPYKK